MKCQNKKCRRKATAFYRGKEVCNNCYCEITGRKSNRAKNYLLMNYD